MAGLLAIAMPVTGRYGGKGFPETATSNFCVSTQRPNGSPHDKQTW
jgi:hypothetical protein